MTHDECTAALARYDRRAVVLALVAQIRPDVLARCQPEHRDVCARALDIVEAWALGRATEEGCRAAANAAYDAAYDAATYAAVVAYVAAANAASAASYAARVATYAASYAAAAAYAAADAAYAASADGATNSAAVSTGRARLVKALAHAPAPTTQWHVLRDVVLAGESVWTGSEWVPLQEAQRVAAVAVTLDEMLEMKP